MAVGSASKIAVRLKTKNPMKPIIRLFLTLCCLLGIGCPASAETDAILKGSGATFPQPLYKNHQASQQAGGQYPRSHQ